MPTNSPLQSIVLSSSASSITFSNIPQIYQDLRLVCSNIVSSGNMDVTMYVNGDTGANYSTTSLNGDGTTARSGRVSTQSKAYVSDYQVAIGGTNPSMFIVNLINYSNATTYKTFLSRGTIQGASSTGETNANVSLWRSTAAVTSITIQTSSGTMGAGSTFDLYGILTGTSGGTSVSALSPKATGGDVIASDGTYWYHAFKSTAAFVPSQNLTCDYLIVGAGSGGGGHYGGPGGGGGGIQYLTSQSLTASTSYTATIGQGGAASNSSGGGGGAGNSSSFNGTTAGGGLANTGYNGTGSTSGSPQSKGGGSTFNGAAIEAGGGGGGAGAVGQSANGTTRVAGTGGVGLNTYSSWATATSTGDSGYYAGGGGGGHAANSTGAAGGTGGGGSGTGSGAGGAGTANTGGGGGGGSNGNSGGQGGSGIVIVRYAV